ncbi:Hypothetical predicted protein [Mytilus galloprovincialis]|uniref:CCHC-type domain-containing protein n=1 Tax=Mytilus galloprovincialis TaxID=29158 RepID=A0A8B6CTN2_MYTGA|nr:Hypothetical predicted protein [Mytilus galloprovincialis]
MSGRIRYANTNYEMFVTEVTSSIGDCNNDWKCKTCGTKGHMSKNCTAEVNKNSQADLEVSSEESDESSEDESEKGGEVILTQLTENLIGTPNTEETSTKAGFPKDTNNIQVPDQKTSESNSDKLAHQSPKQNLIKR